MARLFVSDLDGTLADRNARLSDFTRRTLRELIGDGLAFTVATARAHASLAPILEGVPIALPVIEFNGAYLTDLPSGESFFCEALAPEVAESAVRHGTRLEAPPFVSTYAERRQRLYPPRRVGNAGQAWYLDSRQAAADPRLRAADDPLRVIAEQTTCLTFIAQRELLAELKQMLEEEHPGATNSLLYRNPYQRDWHWLTVQSSRANKATALGRLAERVGVRLDEVTVFGDEVNDVEMFEAAGTAVAVDNAVDELKSRATEVIGPHHADSVVRYLLEHV